MPGRLRRFIPRFSLRTLVVFLLLVTSGVGLWWRWQPWRLDRILAMARSDELGLLFSPDGASLLIAARLPSRKSPPAALSVSLALSLSASL